MFKNILMVCIGNICRSPTAEILLREALPAQGFSVSSAGISALVDKPIETKAEEVLRSNGHAIHEHRARQLTREMLHAADLVLVMERPHMEHIQRMAPEARGKVFLLGKWQDERDVPDPYRKDEAAFTSAYQLIDEGVAAWASRIHR